MGNSLSEWQERLGPILDARGVELLEVHFARRRTSLLLRFFVDREGGIGVDDLADLSRRIGRLLDADSALAGNYSLEVSSPGMNRVVRTEDHFRRFRGERVHLWTESPRDGRDHFEGTIGDCRDGVVSVVVDKAGTLRFPLEELRRAELRLDPRKRPAGIRRSDPQGQDEDRENGE